MPEDLNKPPQTPEEIIGVTQDELDAIAGYDSSMSWQQAVRSVFKDNSRAERYISLTEEARKKAALEPEPSPGPVAEPTPEPEPEVIPDHLSPDHPRAHLDKMEAQIAQRKAEEEAAEAARREKQRRDIDDLLRGPDSTPPDSPEPDNQ